MNNNTSCLPLFFVLTPAMIYWITSFAVFVESVRLEVVWYKALAYGIVWPLVLAETIAKIAAAYP